MEIVQRALSGDQDAYTTLYNNNYPSVIRMLENKTYNRAEAEDLAQDSFLHAFTKLHQYKGKSKFSTWLYRIVLNTFLCYNRSKHNKIFHSELVDIDLFYEQYPVEDIRLKGVLDRITLKNAIKRVHGKRQAIYVLKYILGYTNKECSELFDISLSNVKSTEYRARLAMKEYIQ